MLEQFEDRFKELAETYEVPYNANDWENLCKRMRPQNNKFLVWKRMAISAAILLLLVGFSYILIKNNILNDTNISKQKNIIVHKNTLNQKNVLKNNKIDIGKKNEDNSLKNNIYSENNTKNNLSNTNNFSEYPFDKEIKSNILSKKIDKNLTIVKNNIENNDVKNIYSYPLLSQELNRETPDFQSIEIKPIENNQKPKISKWTTALWICADSVSRENTLALISKAKANGTQIAVFANVTPKEEVIKAEDSPIFQKRKKRIQIAGLFNNNQQDYQDIQLALLGNSTKKINQLQSSFLFNQARELNGTQIGFVNYAKKMKGRQFGIINIADSAQGTPIGLITIVGQNAYQKLEVGASEMFQTHLNFKLGTRKFYNIFSIATGYSEPNLKWAIGYGFGREFRFSEKHTANLDFSAFHLSQGNRFTRELNTVLQTKFNYHIKVAPKMTLFMGPALNLFLSDVRSLDLNFRGITPYTIAQGYIGNTASRLWLGLNFGLGF
jgi:hypothetical protein